MTAVQQQLAAPTACEALAAAAAGYDTEFRTQQTCWQRHHDAAEDVSGDLHGIQQEGREPRATLISLSETLAVAATEWQQVKPDESDSRTHHRRWQQRPRCSAQ